jgi:hypothetical protein
LERSLEYENRQKTHEETFGDVLEAGRLLDPATMSLERHEMLPPEIIWALSRASLRLHVTSRKISSHFDMAREFVRLMKLEGESIA